MKCSQLDQSGAHEVQALMYSLLLPGVRDYEIVNLMRGRRFRRRIRPDVELGSILASALTRLYPGDQQMVASLLEKGSRPWNQFAKPTKPLHEDAADDDKQEKAAKRPQKQRQGRKRAVANERP